MATYYVGIGGNDGNNGTTWVLRKLTLNGAEDLPVAASDTVYVGPGVYRELLTVDVAGGAGANVITYIGDVTGEHTDSVGGIVRVTGSDNDTTEARANCIVADTKDYRTFRGFTFDTTSDSLVEVTDSQNWIIEDCVSQNRLSHYDFIGADTTNTVRRCFLWGGYDGQPVSFWHSASVDSSAHLVENCIILGGLDCIRFTQIGEATVRNCLLAYSADDGVDCATGPDAGHANIVTNCIIIGCDGNGLEAVAVADMTENYNTFYGNAVDRLNVNVGANSQTYPPLFLPPILFSGVSQVSGYQIPWWFSKLNEWSPIRAITGSNEPTEDLLGIARPPNAAQNSWGPMQFHDAERETTTKRTGAASFALHDAGRHQMWVPVANEETTISVYVYREANYAGNNPQMIVKQPGQADDTTTDAAAASQWNLLTTTLTPAALPPYVVVELISRNTAAAGNYETFFDDLAVS